MLENVAGYVNRALPAISAIMSGATAAGQWAQGDEARAIGDAEADQFDRRATQTRAVGSRQAERLRKANERLRGRQRTLLAASGFSASDVGARVLDDATVKEGTINELLLVAQAEDEARQDEERGRLRRKQGRSEQQAYRLAAGRTLVEGFVTWRERFGRAPATGGGGHHLAGARDGGYGTPPFIPETLPDDSDRWHRNR